MNDTHSDLDRKYTDMCALAYRLFPRDAERLASFPEHFLKGEDGHGFKVAAAEMLIALRKKMDAEAAAEPSEDALNRVISAARGDLRGVITDGQSWCVAGGRMVVRLLQDVPGLPRADGKFPFSEVIEKAKAKAEPLEEMPFPSETDVRVCLASQSAAGEDGPFWTGGSPLDPDDILNMLRCLPHCRAYFPASPNDPVYVKSEFGDGLLYPVDRM